MCGQSEPTIQTVKKQETNQTKKVYKKLNSYLSEKGKKEKRRRVAHYVLSKT